MTATTLQLDPAGNDEDVRQLSAAFETLAPGASLLLETPGNPRKLARRFIDTAWGQFDWMPLATDTEVWRTEVRRRAEPGPNTVSTFLTEDHKRCDRLYAEAETAALAGHAKRTAGLFAMFRVGLLRHLNMEEQGLFPDLERRMGFFGGGPTAVMREEHEQIRALLARMDESLRAEDLQGFADGCETLLILMEQHNMKEEEVLYPMMDEAFAGEEADRIKQLLTF
ncbi:MAG TPA: hemerythrin domain-containing protein [bacterium]